MKAERGLVVLAKAGRDEGRWFVVVEVAEQYVFIVDGKTRKLESPKKKNIKHIQVSKHKIDMDSVTDKKLRKALEQFND